MTRLLHARVLGAVLRRLRHGGADRGVALASVIGLGMVLLLLSVTMASVAVSGTVKARDDSDFNAAIAAAYAGVEDYQSKLANNNAYSQFGAKTTSFSAGSTFTGTDGNPAFGKGTAGSWQTVGDGTGASYRYEVDNSKYSTAGTLRIRSTGRVGDTTRSVVADLKQDGFLDYVYFTDYEISDPVLSSTKCVPKYEWAVTSRPSCTTIQFAASDVIDGPMHTNDTMLVCGGTQFKGSTTTSSTRAARYVSATGATCTGTPNFGGLTKPAYAQAVTMPQTNEGMRQETRSDLGATTVPNPGCLYTGPTRITMKSDGTMNVYSPYTKATQIQADESKGSTPAMCGTPGDAIGGGTLGSVGGQNVKVPANNLVYVQDVPASPTNVNYWGSKPTNFSCRNADDSGAGNGLGFPAEGEVNATYSCTAGDVFVQGTLKGNLTIAAQNYVYVTGDVKYSDVSTDMLGLVGTNAVYVYNPVRYYGTGWDRTVGLIDRTESDRIIQAAVLSVSHTFTVQNYAADSNKPKGKLKVLGSISQKFRGPVATTGGTGYTKNYTYDPRMRYTAPPKFLSPVSTSYGITQVVESKTAVASTGRELVP